jgi:iron complex outermembrane receptor protein
MTKHLTSCRPAGRRSPRIFQAVFTVLLALALSAGLGAAEPVRKDYDLPAAAAAAALKQFSAQSGEQLLFSADAVAGVTTQPVKGRFTAREALDRLVAGTNLIVQQDERTGALAVTRKAPAENKPAPAPKAAAKGEDSPVLLEKFVVTGSNIHRLDQERVLPLTVITPADMAIRDASQPSDLLQALPMVTGLPGNETAFATQNARGDNASVSLRGLVSGNTLILLNGRRLVPHPISQSEGTVIALSTNVNQLPNRGLASVEVLRDGASSIYGTDAVAGVVNYITQTRFTGTELALHYGETSYHDGKEVRATLTHGLDFANNKGHFLIIADFYDRQAIYQRDRPFDPTGDLTGVAPAPWNVPTDTTFNFRSTSSAYGSYLTGMVTATDQYGTVTTFSRIVPNALQATLMNPTSGLFAIVPVTGSQPVIAKATPTRAASGPGFDYFWNSNVYRVIQPQSTRGNIFTDTTYELNDRITAFADLSLYRAHSYTYREPDTYSASSDGFLIVPTTNPYNPFGTRFWDPAGAPNADGTPRLTGTPLAVSITNKRFEDLATRLDTVTDSVYRGLVGLRGKVADSWNWESAALWSEGRATEYEAGSTRRSLLKAAINQTDPTLAFNPFEKTFAVQNGTIAVTGEAQNPESVIATFRAPYIRSGTTKLGSGDFKASGEIYPIWGGNVISGAFGGEFRYESYDDVRPPFVGLSPASSGLNPTLGDFVSASSRPDTHGQRHVAAAYAESVIPLLNSEHALPLVHALELTASARFERYSDFGSTVKPKYGLNWKPAPWMMVRASYNEGFHAPNLAELFTGSQISKNLGAKDTYRANVTQLATDSSTTLNVISSGNSSLRPEKSVGKSGGIVIDVPRITGLSLSVDYWEIRQKDVIASGGGIPDDTAALLNATQAALAAGQNINSIDLGSGTPGYKGDASVVRLPVTQADKDLFAAYNATQPPGNQRAVVGAINYTLASYFNKAEQFVNGFDFDLNYRLPRMALGNFTFDTAWTLLNSFYSYNAAGAPRTELRDSNGVAVGGATPRWRGTVTLRWQHRHWGAGVGMYYTGSFTDVAATTSQTTYDSLGDPGYIRPVFSNGAYSYRYVVHDSESYNVNLNYRFTSKNQWLNDTEFRLGINNVLNTKPPLSANSIGYDPTVYNVMARGRTFSFQITKKL